MDADPLARAAALLRERNAIGAELAELIQRPMTSGHLGEWIAAQIFGIEQVEASAAAAGIDGRFRSGALQDRAVNIKWYLKREGVLDTTESEALDYYLVLAGRRQRQNPRGHHPALVHPGRVLVRRAAASVRADHTGSKAGRCLQRHQAAVGSRRDLPHGHQSPAGHNLAAG